MRDNRPTTTARYSGTCPRCATAVMKGERIAKPNGEPWVHAACARVSTPLKGEPELVGVTSIPDLLDDGWKILEAFDWGGRGAVAWAHPPMRERSRR